MIDTRGLLTVAEAAERLQLSPEQVRRKLRDGKLRGRRIGRQWFLDERDLRNGGAAPEPLIPRQLIEEVKAIRRRIADRNERLGLPPFDVLEMLRRHRDEDE